MRLEEPSCTPLDETLSVELTHGSLVMLCTQSVVLCVCQALTTVSQSQDTRWLWYRRIELRCSVGDGLCPCRKDQDGFFSPDKSMKHLKPI